MARAYSITCTKEYANPTVHLTHNTDMRPAANESLYRELDLQEGVYEYNLPEEFAIRPLTIRDLNQCVALEEKGFPPNERASRDKLEYRLTVCPELCAGLFYREYKWVEKPDMNIVVSDHNNLTKERLVGHIIATKTSSEVIDDASMEIGAHDEDGDTIAVHSVIVDPEFQGKHFGHIMLKDYVQKFFALCNAERISLIAHAELESFYTKHGFKDIGVSKCEHGGVKWQDFVLPLDTYDDQPDLYME